MAWFSRITRFGDVHLVFGQEANMSCGIASVMMCVFKIKKMQPTTKVVYENTEIYKAYSTQSGGVYKPDQVGTHPNHLVKVLDSLGCGKWTWSQLSGAAAADKIIKTVGVSAAPGPTLRVNPVIIGVDWSGGGAHWAVVDTIRSVFGWNYATVCDPWDANVHVQPIDASKPFVYKADEGGFAMDFWGEHKGQTKPYPTGAKGHIKTWGIIHRLS